MAMTFRFLNNESASPVRPPWIPQIAASPIRQSSLLVAAMVKSRLLCQARLRDLPARALSRCGSSPASRRGNLELRDLGAERLPRQRRVHVHDVDGGAMTDPSK